jgi:hypothetical protein
MEPDLKYALWCAWYELNGIRARDGAPDGVDHEWFSTVVEQLEAQLGEKYLVPWPPRIVDKRDER